MGLIKYKLGNLVELSEAKNANLKYGIDDVKGISIQKVFIETKADMTGVSLRPYYLVQPDDFAYVTVTSRNGEKITIAHNTTDYTYIVSSSYVVFRVKHKSILLSDYLFMYFNRPEFDRYSRFNSWGSTRETFNWSEMCDIDIELPPIEVQQKYVDVYNSMLTNQQNYERGLDDLRLVYEGYFDKLKAKSDIVKSLGCFIAKQEHRNIDAELDENQVRGISNQKEFMFTKADIKNQDVTKFYIVEPGVFAYNSRTDGREMLVLALNKDTKPILVTWNYNVFKIVDDSKNILDSEYLYAFLRRSEFDRRVRFMSWGSSQELFSWESLCEIQIPVPDIKIQRYISDVNIVYQLRKEINKQLKAQIREICPILIRGSLEEGGET